MIATADTNDAWPDFPLRLSFPVSLFPRALCAFSCRPRVSGEKSQVATARHGVVASIVEEEFFPALPPPPIPSLPHRGSARMLPSISQRTVHVGGRSPRPGLQPLSRIARGARKAASGLAPPQVLPSKTPPASAVAVIQHVLVRGDADAAASLESQAPQKKLLQRRLRGQRPAPEGRNKARGGPGGHLDGSGRMEQNVGIECLRVLCLFACLSVCPADRYGAASQETKEHRTSSSDARLSPPALHSLSSRIRFHLHEQAPPPRLVLPPPFSHSHDPPDPTGAAPSTAASPRCEPGINLGKSALDFFLIFPVRFFLSLFSSFPSILHACS